MMKNEEDVKVRLQSEKKELMTQLRVAADEKAQLKAQLLMVAEENVSAREREIMELKSQVWVLLLNERL